MIVKFLELQHTNTSTNSSRGGGGGSSSDNKNNKKNNSKIRNQVHTITAPPVPCPTTTNKSVDSTSDLIVLLKGI